MEDRSTSLHLWPSSNLKHYQSVQERGTHFNVPPETLSLSIPGFWNKRDNKVLKKPIFLSKLVICRLYLYLNRCWMLSAICIASSLQPRADAVEPVGGGHLPPLPLVPVLHSIQTRLGRGLGPVWTRHPPVTFVFSKKRKQKNGMRMARSQQKGRGKREESWWVSPSFWPGRQAPCTLSALNHRAQGEQKKAWSVLCKQSHLGSLSWSLWSSILPYNVCPHIFFSRSSGKSERARIPTTT